MGKVAPYLLGLDVGSTTVKVAVMDGESKEVLYHDYRRHGAKQAQTLLQVLKETNEKFPGAVFAPALCGSGGKDIATAVDIPYIQEVVANSLAVKALFPQTKVAIELGGQDAKLIFFHQDETTGETLASDMRMNGSCAGGTGAFIDEVGKILGIPVEEFESRAAKGDHAFDISGRCGVFAKTDIQPLLNQGVSKEDLALSTFHAIAKQTIGGLAQGLEIPSSCDLPGRAADL
jgi:activator of 2-hydroxyglutaryl-CoA dehydratase